MPAPAAIEARLRRKPTTVSGHRQTLPEDLCTHLKHSQTIPHLYRTRSNDGRPVSDTFVNPNPGYLAIILLKYGHTGDKAVRLINSL